MIDRICAFFNCMFNVNH